VSPGQVIPWNFPLLMLAWKVAPALAAGNTVVPQARGDHAADGAALRRDLPAGRPAAGRGQHRDRAPATPAAPSSPTRTSTRSHSRFHRGREGHRPCRRRHRQEGDARAGGKAANIVFDDAPVDQAVEGIVNGIFFNQGHVCCAGSRLLVQESVADEVLDAPEARMATLRVGDPLDKNTDVGAINSAEQLARIRELSDVGEAEGAGRWSPECELPTNGFWFPPTIFTGVTQAHRIAREEIFGPVLSVLTFRTPAEAVEKANNTPYGLSAGVWTDKGSRILWMANQLRAGVVWANTFNKFDPPRRSAATRSRATAARAGCPALPPTSPRPGGPTRGKASS
jgi:acyl-CoA reductase-like NAD-dependent aldehyde dehydrogenase